LYTAKEAGEQLRVSAATVLRQAKLGRIVLTRIGAHNFFTEADIQAFVESCRRTPDREAAA